MSVYSGATFQANAAKFNIVDFGPFMGAEQQGFGTFKTIFQNIKANAAANGINCRLLHYFNSWAQTYVAGAGAQSTFTVWTNEVAAANWYMRVSYPAGATVNSTFTANDGMLAQTPNNKRTYQPTGETISAGLCLSPRQCDENRERYDTGICSERSLGRQPLSRRLSAGQRCLAYQGGGVLYTGYDQPGDRR
jgi:hypothetical protein